MSGKTTTIEELDALNNNELRAKFKEYGLPNVPITDTSRKLLVRRLHTAMTGGQTPSKAKENAKSNRRETVHVTKLSTTATTVESIGSESVSKKQTPNKVSSRRTIGGPSEIAVEEPVVQASSITQRRRSGRTTPNTQVDNIVVTTSVKPTVSNIQEEDDDDVVIIVQDMAERERKSRSPSLSKSELVTTSYKQHVIPVVMESNEEEIENVEFPLSQARAPPFRAAFDASRSSFGPSRPIHEEPKYQPTDEHFKSVYEAPKFSYADPKPTYSQPKPTEEYFKSVYEAPKPSYEYVKQTIRSTPEKDPKNRYSYVPSVSRQVLPEVPAPSSTYSKYESSSSSTNRRYTTSGYKPATEINSASRGISSQLLHSTDNSDENDEEDLEAPYLSDFARRLTRLKAEPLDVGLGEIKRDTAKLRENHPRYYQEVGGRRTIGRKSTSISDSFYQFCIALEQKYNVKKNLAIIAVILLIVFVYIFFFH